MIILNILTIDSTEFVIMNERKGGDLYMYKQIVVAMDFSEPSKLAFERASDLAAATGAALTVVSVIDNRSTTSVATYDMKYAEQLKGELTEQLQVAKEKANAKGVDNVKTAVEVGSPKIILTSFDEADLIVCGATGLNAAERLFIGSISETVVRRAACDVLIVRAA